MDGSGKRTTGFLGEIQGLRAIAVLLVLAFHARVPQISGGFIGVDIFFVISGYLITLLLIEEHRQTGTLDLLSFYARRAKRLLPASLFVTMTVTVVYWFVVSPLETKVLTSTAIATVAYMSNIWFALSATDYLGGDAKEDPLLHTWSLGVEEQYYLIWPLLALFLLSKLTGARIILVTLALSSMSLVASIVYTQIAQPWAFFLLPMRAWEFGVGTLVALVFRMNATTGMSLTTSKQIAQIIGIVGFLLIAFGATWLDQFSAFPGFLALIPVLGTALVIVSIELSRASGIAGILRSRVLGFFGDISYSLYLWHWPLLVLLFTYDRDPSAIAIAVTCGLSLLFALLSYHLIENPFRRARASGWWALGLLGAISLTVLAGLWAIRTLSNDESLSPSQATFMEARQDNHRYLRDDGCYVQYFETDPLDCSYGGSRANASIMVFGDSHAAHWIPGLSRIASSDGFAVIPAVKSACPSVSVEPFDMNLGRKYFECTEWRDRVFDQVRRIKPDILVLGNFEAVNYPDVRALHFEPEASWETALRGTIASLPENQQIVIVRDIPNPRFNVPTCFARIASGSLLATDCTYSLSESLREDTHQAARRVANSTPNVHYLDLTHTFCEEGASRCPTRSSEHLYYFDSHHMTASQSRVSALELVSELRNLGLLPQAPR